MCLSTFFSNRKTFFQINIRISLIRTSWLARWVEWGISGFSWKILPQWLVCREMIGRLPMLVCGMHAHIASQHPVNTQHVTNAHLWEKKNKIESSYKMFHCKAISILSGSVLYRNLPDLLTHLRTDICPHWKWYYTFSLKCYYTFVLSFLLCRIKKYVKFKVKGMLSEIGNSLR